MNLTKKKLLFITIISLSIPQLFHASHVVYIKNDIQTKTHALVKFVACRSWSKDLAPKSFYATNKHGSFCMPRHIYFTIYHPIGNNQFVLLRKNIALREFPGGGDSEEFIIQGPFSTEEQLNKITYTIKRFSSFGNRTRHYSVSHEPD
ncbi:MAG: hypothetical protein WBQ73_01055 [Candidatus Babeliales bacterium]